MEGDKKLSIKRVEISLNNFNDIAIPHHIDLLKKHKTNILKYQNVGDLDKIKNEQINATRTVVQLKHLLEEIDGLRKQIMESDIDKFDKMTEKSRNITFKAIKEYMDMSQYSQSQASPSVSSGYSSHSPATYDRGNRFEETFQYPSTSSDKLLLQADDRELSEEQCKQEELCFKSWEKLQDEVQDLHEIFVKFHEVTKAQRENVMNVERNVELADVNVQQGTEILARTERMKTKWYPVAGALLGGCLAGPIGLIAGFKMGGFALISGTALGFTSGRFLKKKLECDNVSTCVKDDLGDVKHNLEDSDKSKID